MSSFSEKILTKL